MGMCLALSCEHKEANVTEGAKAVGEEDKGLIAGGRQIMEGLVDHHKDFGFFSRWNQKPLEGSE